MRMNSPRRAMGIALGLIAASLPLAGCRQNSQELSEELSRLREQQRQILAKLGDQEKKIDTVRGTRPAARRRPGPDPERVYSLPANNSPIKGPQDAPITIVEFSDYQCPFCSRSEPLIDQVLRAYPTQVRLIVKHFPLTSIHPHATGAARAAVAAQKQGKFWEMHELLFTNQKALSPEHLKNYAEQLGLDMEQFEADIRSPEVKSLVEEDMRLAQQTGVRGTPTVFVNGNLLQNRSLDGFKQVIDTILQERQKQKG